MLKLGDKYRLKKTHYSIYPEIIGIVLTVDENHLKYEQQLVSFFNEACELIKEHKYNLPSWF